MKRPPSTGDLTLERSVSPILFPAASPNHYSLDTGRRIQPFIATVHGLASIISIQCLSHPVRSRHRHLIFFPLMSDDRPTDRRFLFACADCGYACSRRCVRSSRKKVCHRACKSCCSRCHCVPPGTSGNVRSCPCYASLRTHGNKPKCP